MVYWTEFSEFWYACNPDPGLTLASLGLALALAHNPGPNCSPSPSPSHPQAWEHHEEELCDGPKPVGDPQASTLMEGVSKGVQALN